MGAVKDKKEFETIEEYIEFLRHFASYLFAEEYVTDNDILEIGCGNGYGSYHLSEYARSVTAIDMSKENIHYCANHYSKDNLRYMVTDGTNLPFHENSFDCVISFQVIEHIDPENVTLYIEGIKKVLKDKGILILTTPNKKLRLLPFQKPWNEEHMVEYDKKSFEKLLSQYFTNFNIFGVVGSKKILKIELNRVKQSYFNVYIYRPLTKLAKKFWKTSKNNKTPTKTKISSKNELFSKEALKEELKQFSVDDFEIDKNCPEESLDIIAICRINK